MTYQFTTSEILYKVANWELEPFTLEELNSLIFFLAPSQYDFTVIKYYYAENDIESFILHIISES